MEIASELLAIRQGMKVAATDGTFIGFVRDVSRGSVLVMERGSSRVYWIPVEAVLRVDGQQVVVRVGADSAG